LMTAQMRAFNLDAEQKSDTQRIWISACYHYENIFGHEVCIDPSMGRPAIDNMPGCTSATVSDSGQGGPVGVSKVEVSYRTDDQPLGDGAPVSTPTSNPDRVKPMFRIYFKNFGSGEIISPSSVAECGAVESIAGKNPVTIKVDASYFDIPMTCTPRNPAGDVVLALQDDTRYIECIYEAGVKRAEQSFYVPLVVKFEYGYKQTWTKSVEVKASR
jgi:hypothetical protein